MDVAKCISIRIAAVAALLCLLAGCGGSGSSIEDVQLQSSLTAQAELLGAEGQVLLPAPQTIKTQTVANGSSFSWARDYETDLPYLGMQIKSDGRLQYIGSPLSKISYTIYSLDAPAYETVRRVKLDPAATGFNSQLWIGIADFEMNRWDFSNVLHANFDEQHIDNGRLLVAVVCSSYAYVNWLSAGELAPPIVRQVFPSHLSANAINEFRAVMTEDQATDYFWEFDGGVSPGTAVGAEPQVFVEEPGDYAGILTVGNLAGTTTFEFTYRILPEMEYEPLHIYAIAENQTVQVGEELLVTIRTGWIPEEIGLLSGRYRMLLDSSFEYVPNSLNIGSPGGAKDAIDGFWDAGGEEKASFLAFSDAWIANEDLGDGNRLFGMFTSALFFPDQYGEGELCNLRFRCTKPGSFRIVLSGPEAADRSEFTNNRKQEQAWHDCTNSNQPSITVLP